MVVSAAAVWQEIANAASCMPARTCRLVNIKWHLAACLLFIDGISHASKSTQAVTCSVARYQPVKIRKKLASGPVGLEALLALPPADELLGVPPGTFVA